MKNIPIICLLFLIAPYAEAQKKPAKEPSLSEIQKQLDNLPPEQKAMMKNMGLDEMMKKPKPTSPNKKTAGADSWEDAEQERINSVGIKTTKTIGSAGGIIKSANGKITLNFPAGALEADTEIGVEETDNTAPLSCGNSFRLTPDGQTFSKPVMLTLKYSDYDIDGAAPEVLAIATESNGAWLANSKTVVDAVGKTISLPIKHFSVWGTAAFLKMEMLPKGDKELGRGQTIHFRITTYKEEADKKAKWEEDFLKKLNELVDEMDKDEAARKRDEELTKQEWKEYVDEVSGGDPDLVPLVKESPKTTQRHIDEIGEKKIIESQKKARDEKDQGDDLVPLIRPTAEKANEQRVGESLKQLRKFKGFKLTAWKLNGTAAPVSNEMGKLNSSEYAFADYTAPLTVPLTKDRVVAISCEFTNLESKAKFLFVSNVTLTNNGWFTATFNGETLYGYQPLDMKYLPQMQGNIGGEATIANANYTDRGEARGLSLLVTNASAKAFILHIPSPHLGQNLVDCKSGAGADFSSQNLVASLVEVKRVKRNDACDETEICHDITINLTAFNLKTGGLVSGDFQGTLYADFIDGSAGECVSKLPKKVSGKFSLSIVIDSDDSKNITIPQKN